MVEAIFDNCSTMDMLTMGAVTEEIVAPSTVRSAVLNYFHKKHKKDRTWSLYLGSCHDFIWRLNEPRLSGLQALWLARRSDPMQDNELLDENLPPFDIEAPGWRVQNLELVRDEFVVDYLPLDFGRLCWLMRQVVLCANGKIQLYFLRALVGLEDGDERRLTNPELLANVRLECDELLKLKMRRKKLNNA